MPGQSLRGKSGVGGICIPCCGIWWEVPLGGVRSEWTLVDKVPGCTKRDVEPNEREQTKDDQGLEGCGYIRLLLMNQCTMMKTVRRPCSWTQSASQYQPRRADLAVFQDSAPLSEEPQATWRGGARRVVVTFSQDSRGISLHMPLPFRPLFVQRFSARCASDPSHATRRTTKTEVSQNTRPWFLCHRSSEVEVQHSRISLETHLIMGALIVWTASRRKFALSYPSIRSQDLSPRYEHVVPSNRSRLQ